MTWLLLGTISWVVVINSYLAGATDTLAPLLMNAVGSTTVFLLAIRHGVGGQTPIDILALLGAVLVFLLSLYVNRPLISLVLALSFDLFAILPTMIKLVQSPQLEEPLPWSLTVVANFLSVLALGSFIESSTSWEILLPPFYFLTINGLVLLLIVIPRQIKAG